MSSNKSDAENFRSNIFQDCKDVLDMFAHIDTVVRITYKCINRHPSRINIQNTCAYICKRNTIVNGDKNRAHIVVKN